MEKIWRETNSKLIKAMENSKEKEGYFEYAKKKGRNAKFKIGLGLMGAAYLGARVFVGPEIVDNIVNNFDSFLSISDITAMLLTFSGVIGGGLDYIAKYEERKNCEIYFKKAKFEYWKILNKEYPIERRTLKNSNNKEE
jgi:hypothetical protein